MVKRRRLAKTSSVHRDLPVSTSGQSRLFLAASVGLAVGLFVIGIVVWMTPLSNDDSQLATASTGGSEVMDLAIDKELAAEVQRDFVSLSAPTPSALQLPLEPEVFDVDALQGELRKLADRLTIDYPDDVASFHFAAQAYAELKQFEKADELWKACLLKSPQYMGPYVGYASMLIDKGRNEEAVEVLKQAQSLGGSAPEMFRKLGEAYENLGDLENSLVSLQSGVEEYPNVPVLWLILGRVQNQLGKASEAELSLRRSLELGGDKESALFVLNSVLLKQRKVAEATANREELVRVKQAKGGPTDTFQESYDLALRGIASEIFAAAGTLAEANDNFAEAERLLMRSVSLNPRNVEAYKSLLVICRRQNRILDQKVVLAKLVEVQPDDIISRTNLASVALQLGDPKLAELTLKKAAQIDPNGVLAQAALAKLYLSNGNYEESRSFAAQVIERRPSSAAYRLLAATYQASGAEDAFQAANAKADELAAAELAAQKN